MQKIVSTLFQDWVVSIVRLLDLSPCILLAGQNRVFFYIRNLCKCNRLKRGGSSDQFTVRLKFFYPVYGRRFKGHS